LLSRPVSWNPGIWSPSRCWGCETLARSAGASQGIGAGVAQSFLDLGYNVVANSRNIRKSGTFIESDHLALVDGSIGDSAVASKIVETAVQKFGSIDALVNDAGIFFTKAFTDYKTEDFKALSSANLEGFIYARQGVVKQMLAQKSGGSVVSITASRVVNPIAGITASVPMITKGGLETITRSLATEYAKEKICSPSRRRSCGRVKKA
jgi:NAD(P)-dependent dehydrogenase (short-subunit alcohol dehydrogenase family)